VIALTLTQPWATLVAIGAKRIETRSWGTSYRGPIAIHAAKGMPRDAVALCHAEPFREALARAGLHSLADLPRGAIVAKARLVDVRPTSHLRQTVGGRIFEPAGDLPTVASAERAFGDYTGGRFMWILEDVVPLPQPVPVRGALGLWDWKG
jgi:hypothetical protein